MKFLYTNIELNLPHHLNYVAALRALETIDLLRHERPDFIPLNLWHPSIPDLNPIDYKIWVIMQYRDYQTKICSMDEWRVIDVCCGLEQSTINMAIDH